MWNLSFDEGTTGFSSISLQETAAHGIRNEYEKWSYMKSEDVRTYMECKRLSKERERMIAHRRVASAALEVVCRYAVPMSCVWLPHDRLREPGE